MIPGWLAVLSGTVGDFVLLAIDDGSTDTTLEVLEAMQSSHPEKMEVRSRPNKGHGQTCMEGYRVAVERDIPFILQIDSDGQSAPCHFVKFWALRKNYDVIYGKRNRRDGFQRVVASRILRTLLRVREGVDCVDANVPYRLMNTVACTREILAVPSFVSLANIALSVLLKRNQGIRHGAIPIDFPTRLGGEPSVPTSRFVVKAIELFDQLKTIRMQTKDVLSEE